MTERPKQFISAGALIPPRVCHLLEERLNLRAIRHEAQGVDDELYQAVHAIHWAAIAWHVSQTRNSSSDSSEEPAVARETEGASSARWASADVVSRLHLSPRRVQQLAAAGEFGAEKRQGRWTFDPALVEQDGRRSA